MIVRFEPWGAWVKLETVAALVALDRDGVRALGLNGGTTWGKHAQEVTHAAGEAIAPLEVHVAVTSRCGAACVGCYLDARPNGTERPRADLLATFDGLQERGVFTLALGGGEPITRDDLPALAAAARARGLTPVLTTSGLGMTAAKAARLTDFAQVNVSYDGAAASYAAVRGFDGARAAERAIGLLRCAGIRVGVNVVLTRANYPHLDETVARARELGACEAQLLRYKPAGRAASLTYLAQRLTAAQASSLGAVLRGLHRTLGERPPPFSLRVDCALVPFLSADPELFADPAAIARLGVLGCEAGAALGAVRADGKTVPCSFTAPLAAEEVPRWEAFARHPTGPCASCALAPVCRGGCRVVAHFLGGDPLAPDPECPRVRGDAHGHGEGDRGDA